MKIKHLRLSKKQEIEKLDYSLSDKDIKKILGKKIKIMAYPEFENIDDIGELLKSNNNQIIIFFEEQNTQAGLIGHWEAMKYDPKTNTIQFFDSYGLKPDEARDYLSKNQLVELKEVKPELTRLLEDASEKGYKIFYNHIQYQSMTHKDVSTCGKWSSNFLLNGNLAISNQYQNYVKGLMKKYKVNTSDLAVVYWCLINYGI
jgi:hypothetical protein